MNNISTIRIKNANGEGWQTFKLLRSDFPEGVLVDNGKETKWLKLDQCHPEDVDTLNENSCSKTDSNVNPIVIIVGAAILGLLVGVVILCEQLSSIR